MVINSSENDLFSYTLPTNRFQTSIEQDEVSLHMLTGGSNFKPQITPKPHQLHAVRNMLSYSREVPLNESGAFFVQHATGSGKSFTEAALSSLLSLEPNYLAVLLLADRTQLCQQLWENCNVYLRAHKMEHKLIKLTTCTQFLSALVDVNMNNSRGAILLTSIQVLWEARKCDFKNMLPWNGRIAIIGDEVHRSQGTGTLLVNSLQSIFRNSYDLDNHWLPKPIVFFGFTATPTESALRMYGNVVINSGNVIYTPMHSFSLHEAQCRGDVCDMLDNYTCLPQIRTRKKIAEEILKHYLICSANLQYIPKAMIVESTRANVLSMARALKNAISIRIQNGQLEPSTCNVHVFFSGTLRNKTQEDYNGVDEKHSLNSADFYIVCDKLRTGYNNINLSMLYINRKFNLKRSHEFTQTLGRVCRATTSKKSAFILDFVHAKTDIIEATQLYIQTTGYKHALSDEASLNIEKAEERFRVISEENTTLQNLSLASLTAEWRHWCSIRDRFGLWKHRNLCNLIDLLNPLKMAHFDFEGAFVDFPDYQSIDTTQSPCPSEYPHPVILQAQDFPSASPGKYGWPKPGMPLNIHSLKHSETGNLTYWRWYVTEKRAETHPLASLTSTAQYRRPPEIFDSHRRGPTARIGCRHIKFASKPATVSKDIPTALAERNDIIIKTQLGESEGTLHIPESESKWFDLNNVSFATSVFESDVVVPFPVFIASRWRACRCKQVEEQSVCDCTLSTGLLDLTDTMVLSSNLQVLDYFQLIVVSHDQVDAYKRCKPHKTIFQLPASLDKTGIGYARFWMEELARKLLPANRPYYFSLDDSVIAWQKIDAYDATQRQRSAQDCSLADVLMWLAQPRFMKESLHHLAVIGFHRYHPGYAYPKILYSRRHVSSALLRNLGDPSLKAHGHGLYERGIFLWEDLDSNYRISGGCDPDGYPPKEGFRNKGGLVCKSYRFAMIKQPLSGGCQHLVARMNRETMLLLSQSQVSQQADEQLICAICSKITRKRTWKKTEEITTQIKKKLSESCKTYLCNGVYYYLFCQKCRLEFLEAQSVCTICGDPSFSGGWKTKEQIKDEAGFTSTNDVSPTVRNGRVCYPICQKCLKNKFNVKTCAICSVNTHVNAWKTKTEIMDRNTAMCTDAIPLLKGGHLVYPICQSCRMSRFNEKKQCAICMNATKRYMFKPVDVLLQNNELEINPLAMATKRKNVLMYTCCQTCKAKYKL